MNPSLMEQLAKAIASERASTGGAVRGGEPTARAFATFARRASPLFSALRRPHERPTLAVVVRHRPGSGRPAHALKRRGAA